MGARTALRSAPRTAASGGLVTGFVLVLLALHASPAAAVEDPTRPDGRVTHGPSCKPGGLVVEVVAGTSPYFVRLATTRQPAAEQLDRGVPAAHVAEHPRHDGPPVEGGAVGPLRGLVAGPARDVGVGARVQRLPSALLEPPGRGRDQRAVPEHARPVDLVLPSPAGAWFVHGLHRSEPRLVPRRPGTAPERGGGGKCRTRGGDTHETPVTGRQRSVTSCII